ncbi:hypothetical protein HQ587_00840, partial [bacterium]|nr:hypothetical protein [bacterium]
MSYTQRIFFIAILITGFFCYGSVIAEITVEPIGLMEFIEADDTLTVELTLFNSGEVDVAFDIDLEEIEDEEERQGGPRRDDPGDVLDEFQMPRAPGQSPTYAKNWDTGMMLLSTYQGFIDIVDPEELEVIESFQPGIGNLGDCCWNDGIYYVSIGGQNRIARYDNDMERLDGDLMSPFNPLQGIAVDNENGWFFVGENWNNNRIHVYENVDGNEFGEELGVIDNYRQYMENN